MVSGWRTIYPIGFPLSPRAAGWRWFCHLEVNSAEPEYDDDDGFLWRQAICGQGAPEHFYWSTQVDEKARVKAANATSTLSSFYRGVAPATLLSDRTPVSAPSLRLVDLRSGALAQRRHFEPWCMLPASNEPSCIWRKYASSQCLFGHGLQDLSNHPQILHSLRTSVEVQLQQYLEARPDANRR